MQASRLVGSKLITQRVIYTKSRLGFRPCTPKSFYCSKIFEQDDQETVKEITAILKNPNWLSQIKASQILPKNLNPDVIESVLLQNQACDPQRLLQFFNWAASRMGTPQTSKSCLILSTYLCKSNKNPSRVLEHMIKTRQPISAVLDAMVGVKLSPVGFSQLINAYKDKGMLNEAVSLLLGSKSCFPNLLCLNYLMRDLLKCNKLDLFWKVYERLVQAKMSPDAYTYSFLISAHCRVGMVEEAKRMISEMGEKGFSPNLVIHNVLIQGLCRAGLVDEAIDYKKSMYEKGLNPDEFTHTIIIDGLCKARRSSDAKLVLEDMRNAKLTPNHITYTALINGFMRERKIEEALKLIDKMIGENCEPQSSLMCVNNMLKDLLGLNKMEFFWDVYEKLLASKIEPNDYTYNFVISAYVKIGKVGEGKRLFFEMGEKGFSPNLVTYNTLIGGLCRAGLVDEAFELKISMAKKGLRPDTYTYTNLVNGLCKLKRSSEAKLLLGDMLHVGLFPDHVTYTAMIDGFLKQGEVDEAYKLKDEMVARGNKGNLVTYCCFIDGLCKLGRFEEAIKILDGMKDEGFSPDIFCYNSLVSGLCRAKRMDKARALLAQMVENGVKPNGFTYGAVISAYNGMGEPKIADVYFREMIGYGIVPDKVILASIIDCHCKQGNSREALSILRNMVGRSLLHDVQIYNAMIQGSSKNNMMELAMEIFSELQAKGLNADVYAYSSLISGFCKQGDLQKAFNLFDEMTHKGIRPNIVTYNTLINALCKSGDILRARELFDAISEKGLAANASTYATIMDGYCKLGNLSEAFKLFDEMPKRGVQADEFVYGALVNACCKEGDTEMGLLLFDRMTISGFPSIPTSSILIDGLCELGKLNHLMFNHSIFSKLIDYHCKTGMIKEAEHLIMEMQKKGVMPKTEAYASLLRSYVKLGENSKIFNVFDDLFAKGTSKDEVTYLVLNGLLEENNLEKSFELLDELLFKRLCSRNVCDGLLNVFCGKGKFYEVLASIDEAKKRGLTEGLDKCKTLVRDFNNGGYVVEVGRVLENMVWHGWFPSSISLDKVWMVFAESEISLTNLNRPT